jgi:hypothetical protein
MTLSFLLTFFHSSKKYSYLYPQRVSPPLKKTRDIFSEDSAAHPVGCERSAASNGLLAHFKFLKSMQNSHYYLQRAVTPTRALSELFAGRRTLKAVVAL